MKETRSVDACWARQIIPLHFAYPMPSSISDDASRGRFYGADMGMLLSARLNEKKDSTISRNREHNIRSDNQVLKRCW